MPTAVINNPNLLGKTIAKVADTWHVNGYWRIFLFTDGSFYATDNKNEPIFACLGRHVQVNDASIAKHVREMAVEVGLISQQTYDAQLALEKHEQAEVNEAADRRLYEQLKARFEGKDKDAVSSDKRGGRTVKRSDRTKTSKSRLADNQGAVETVSVRGHTRP